MEINSNMLKILEAELDTDVGLKVSPVDEGVSTEVYRVVRENDVFYLRMSDDLVEMMSLQVVAHRLLSEKGVKVPEVIAWEDANPDLGRSFMIVREIPGQSLKQLKHSDPENFQNCVHQVLFMKSVLRDREFIVSM